MINTFFNNQSTDIKLSKTQLSKTIQSSGLPGETLANVIGNLGKKALIDLAVSLAKDVFPKLTPKATLSALDKIKEK